MQLHAVTISKVKDNGKYVNKNRLNIIVMGREINFFQNNIQHKCMNSSLSYKLRILSKERSDNCLFPHQPEKLRQHSVVHFAWRGIPA